MVKKKIEINTSELCKEYIETNVGIEALASKYHVGKLAIKKILSDNGIELKKRGKQSLKDNFVVSDWKIEKYPQKEGIHYIAKAKDSDYSTNDYMNGGGFLTSYIRERFGIEATLYERRMYYKRTGNYWWEQWFDILEVEDKPVKKCPYCDWITEDVENNSGAFEQHLRKEHNMSKFDYLKEFPEDIDYFKTVTIYKNLELETDENKFVTCAICGRKLTHIGGTHLKTHNMSSEEYKRLYGANLVCKDMHDMLSALATETNSNMLSVSHSKAEEEIKAYIESLGINCESNRKILQGKEIDIYIPSLNMGFEYDGLRWHNEISKETNYHINKTNICKENGVTLYHIFEDEWLYKEDIVKSRIKSILGKNENKIMARKCDCRKIERKQTNEFLNTYHIQGECISKFNYGLFFKDELVAVMTFGLPRKNLGYDITEGHYELLRYCSKDNTTVVGGASKLLSTFIAENKESVKKITTFADKRWSNGELYYSLGFKHTHDSKPNYYYIVNNRRENRFKYRKSELVKQGFDKDKSEHQIMMERKIYRIYDCGNMVFVKNIF